MNDRDRHFVQSAKRLLDASLHDLDGATQSRLTQARSRALQGRSGAWSMWKPLPAFGMAVAVLVAFFVLRLWGERGMDTALVADLELVIAEDSVEFFENIEFYEWLSTVDAQADDLSHGDAAGAASDLAGSVMGPAATDERWAGDGNARISRVI